jgi:hypothetical protein
MRDIVLSVLLVSKPWEAHRRNVQDATAWAGHFPEAERNRGNVAERLLRLGEPKQRYVGLVRINEQVERRWPDQVSLDKVIFTPARDERTR